MPSTLRILAVLLVVLWMPLCAHAGAVMDTSISNLMVVLRESPGANKQDEALRAMPKHQVTLPGGKEIEFETSWFEYIGDLHIRFVFDAPDSMKSATPEDLERLQLTPEAALPVAVENLKRVYGRPAAVPWNNVMQVKGKSPDLDSSYFLDRDFWRELSKKHPEGIVVSVAKRGGLLYVPLADAKAVDELRRGVAYLHSSSGALRLSSAVYLFKDDRWSVLQPAVQP